MISRTLVGLALAALIAAPSIASAQSPAPMGSGMKMKSSMKTTAKSNSKALKKETMASKHPKKAGEAQSTVPGSPTYSGSSGTGK